MLLLLILSINAYNLFWSFFKKKKHFTYKMNWPNWCIFHYLLNSAFSIYCMESHISQLAATGNQTNLDFPGFQNTWQRCQSICHMIDW